MIDQQIWRSGLPEPDYERIFTETQTIIIHHSASPNDFYDHYSLIRNIYLYHTGVNGWSDIGYNYLIASDGTTFKGRDPGKYPQDKVQGAHFCSENAHTLGICMMGTYTEILPSDTAIDALQNLLAWKIKKDGLQPFGFHDHLLNEQLDVVAGHRQGCSTECPGEELFMHLDNIRQQVAYVTNHCATGVDRVASEPFKAYIQRNPTRLVIQTYHVNMDTEAKVCMYNLSGQTIIRAQVSSRAFTRDSRIIINTGKLETGIYIISFNGHYQKILVRE